MISKPCADADDVAEVRNHEVMVSLAEDDGCKDHCGIPKTNIFIHNAPKHHLEVPDHPQTTADKGPYTPNLGNS